MKAKNAFQRPRRAVGPSIAVEPCRRWRSPSDKTRVAGYFDLEPPFVTVEIEGKVGVGFSGPLELNP